LETGVFVTSSLTALVVAPWALIARWSICLLCKKEHGFPR